MRLSKSLSQTTMIPENIYVTRGADRQLAQIIQDMGRPGYVLVSRQMGKTNLLLNAKRTLESNNCRFIYIDCSTQFGSDRECYRYIIDTIFRTNPEIWGDTRKEFKQNREKGELSPSKEYELELLALLKHYGGKIVIILDEIDALTGCDFSDQVFAQIRSAYFARINFNEFNRLTYVLSGVVEPNQLIKDKNRSPFNIGEKIYLDDFTIEEFKKFLENSKLKYSTDVQSKIYEWTSGHPRMTWDVCSDLEDITLNGENVTPQNVDEVILKLYLTEHNIPPIDNIRQVIISDSVTRNAVNDFFKNPKKLTDEQKSKLYLAGIICFADDMGDVGIKNKVIEKSINKEWFATITKSPEKILDNAVKLMKIGENLDAIELLKEYVALQGDKIEKSKLGAIEHDIGQCFYSAGQYKDAQNYFLLSLNKLEPETEIYYNAIFKLSLCHFALDEYVDCIDKCNKIINSSTSEIIKTKALFNYASSSLYLDYESNIEKAKDIFKNIIKNIDSNVTLDIAETSSLKCLAYTNLAYLAKKDKKLNEAREFYQEAINTKITKCIPSLLLRLYEVSENNDEKISIIEKAFSTIKEYNIIVSSSENDADPTDISKLHFTYSVLYDLLLSAFQINKENFYNSYLFLSKELTGRSQATKEEFIVELTEYAMAKSKFDIASSLINDNIDEVISKDNINLTISTYSILNICSYNTKDKYQKVLSKHLQYFMMDKNHEYKLTHNDYRAFILSILFLRDNKNYISILEICRLLENYYPDERNDVTRNYFIFFYYMSYAYYKLNIKEKANHYAQKTLKTLKNFGEEPASLVDVNSLESIRKHCEEIIHNTQPRTPYVRKDNKVGRNDPCLCGSGLKFKKCHGKKQ